MHILSRVLIIGLSSAISLHSALATDIYYPKSSPPEPPQIIPLPAIQHTSLLSFLSGRSFSRTLSFPSPYTGLPSLEEARKESHIVDEQASLLEKMDIDSVKFNTFHDAVVRMTKAWMTLNVNKDAMTGDVVQFSKNRNCTSGFGNNVRRKFEGFTESDEDMPIACGRQSLDQVLFSYIEFGIFLQKKSLYNAFWVDKDGLHEKSFAAILKEYNIDLNSVQTASFYMNTVAGRQFATFLQNYEITPNKLLNLSDNPDIPWHENLDNLELFTPVVAEHNAKGPGYQTLQLPDYASRFSNKPDVRSALDYLEHFNVDTESYISYQNAMKKLITVLNHYVSIDANREKTLRLKLFQQMKTTHDVRELDKSNPYKQGIANTFYNIYSYKRTQVEVASFYLNSVYGYKQYSYNFENGFLEENFTTASFIQDMPGVKYNPYGQPNDFIMVKFANFGLGADIADSGNLFIVKEDNSDKSVFMEGQKPIISLAKNPRQKGLWNSIDGFTRFLNINSHKWAILRYLPFDYFPFFIERI